MRVVLIIFLAVCLSEAVGSRVTRAEYETATDLCSEHSGLDAVETMPSLSSKVTHLTAVCRDGSKVLRKTEGGKP
jgi:hypothetical protein